MQSLSLLAICLIQFLSGKIGFLFYSRIYLRLKCFGYLKVYGDDLPWNYGSAGPDAWPYLADLSECGGFAQSPIDIIPDSALPDKSLVDIIFSNYNQDIKFKLKVDSYTGK